jgi:uncharacterized membrane protein YhaH (DUF805 family)
MTFAQSVRFCLSNYATFSGRASRSEYWWFTLFVSLVAGGLSGLGVGLGLATRSGEAGAGAFGPIGWVFMGLAGLFVLGMLMPMWAVAVRRFHDRDLSGWVYLGLALAGLIPYVGFLASIGSFVISVLPSTPGGNRFGPHPQATSADVFA